MLRLPIDQVMSMSNPTRRQKIERMLVDQPNDVELRYFLALEMRSEGDSPASNGILRELVQPQSPYVPAYLMVAQQLVELEDFAEARTFLREGIEEARRQNDSHAAAEMAELLSQLGTWAKE
jgi:hypothetical protein